MPMGLANSEIPRLFGGGCVVQNNHLIITGAFTWPQRKLAKSSYKINLNYIKLNDQQEAHWTPVYPVTKIPGDLISIPIPGTYDAMFYIPGGYSKDYTIPDSFNKALQRRQNDEGNDMENNIFGSTKFFEDFRKKFSNSFKSPVFSENFDPFRNPSEDFENAHVKEKKPEVESQISDFPSSEKIINKSPDGPDEAQPFKPNRLEQEEGPKHIKLKSESPKDNLAKLPKISEMYLKQLEDNIRIAVYYNNQLFFLENLHNPLKLGDPLKTISIYDYKSNKVTSKFTLGDIPVFKAGFSATHSKNKLFITGGHTSTLTTTDFIHILNLDKLYWDRYQIPGLKSTKNGCLQLHKDILIHSFGQKNQEYSSVTNIIDTKTWSLVSSYNSSKLNKTPGGIKPSETNSKELIIIVISSIIIGILLIVLIIFLVYKYRQFRAKIKLPQYHQEPVWADSPLDQFNNPVDVKLDQIHEYNSYDNTQINPMSFSNTTQIGHQHL